MRVIICGGRDYKLTSDDWNTLYELNHRFKFSEVVVGGAQGADAGGKAWADFEEIPVKVFPADWKTYGRSAGPRRNEMMADYADAIVIFPGGKGTADMRSRAMKRGLHVLYDATPAP